MATVEEFLCQGGSEKFSEAVKVNDIESRSDPENDPYKSKYKARELLVGLMAEIALLEQVEGTKIFRTALTAAVLLRLGMNYVECEELSAGQDHLDRCLEVLEDYKLNPLCCNTLQIALNQLGILWSGRDEIQRAHNYLQSSEALYEQYHRDVGSSPVISDDLFEPKYHEMEGQYIQKRINHFENTYTHTLYYLAQVYGKMGDNSKSAKYCHETLRRQLETKTYDVMDWAINAATLSQYYITQMDFPQAKHCLASACYILQETGDPPKILTVTPNPEESQEELFAREKIPKAWADVYRCWTKYALVLLEYSREKLFQSLDADEGGDQTTPHNSDTADETEAKDQIKFDLELTAIETEISDKRCLDFEDARAVFLPVQKWLNSAKEFYVLDGHCTDHVELVQDHSKLFKDLAFFEPDFERQCKMHKRRVDMLDAILDQISMQHYLLICRQLIYEMAETYSSMVDIKLAIVESHGTPPSPHATKKINHLIKSSIAYYDKYIDSLKDSKKEIPSKFSSDDERPALVAYFCTGRLYSKFLEFETGARLSNLSKSLESYKYVVDYCKRNPESEETVINENEICKEMVALLPAKMDRIRSQESPNI